LAQRLSACRIGRNDRRRLPKSRCRYCSLRLVRVARPAEPLRIRVMIDGSPDSRLLTLSLSSLSAHRLLLRETNRMGKGLSPASPAMFRPSNGASIKAATQMQAQALDPAHPAPPASATNIAEQLDDQERRKYVKGTPLLILDSSTFTNPSQARNSVQVNTPTSSPLTSSRIPPSSSPSRRSRSAPKYKNGASPTILSAKSNSSRSWHTPTSSVYSPSSLPRTRT
jgi:hypothetical protein